MTNKPRVVHVIDELPPDGAERLIVDVLSSRSDHFDYRVLCLVRGGELQQDIEALGVPVDILGKRAGFDLTLILRLRKWLLEQQIDVVHTHLFTADFWARLAASLAGIRVVFSTSHSENNWKTGVHRFLDRRLAQLSTRVIACTPQVQSVLTLRDGIPEHKVCVVNNGIDLKRFDSMGQVDLATEFNVADDCCVIAIIGRYHPVKGQLYFLDVFARLLKERASTHEGYREPVHLLLVGEGGLRAEIEQKIISLGITASVTLTGFRRDVPALLNSVDIVAVPSELEGLPMVVLESMARGRAVVAHDVGGISDVISNDFLGRVVAAGDVDQLFRALNELISDPELRTAMGAKASELVRSSFDARETSAAYEELYRCALAKTQT